MRILQSFASQRLSFDMSASLSFGRGVVVDASLLQRCVRPDEEQRATGGEVDLQTVLCIMLCVSTHIVTISFNAFSFF